MLSSKHILYILKKTLSILYFILLFNSKLLSVTADVSTMTKAIKENEYFIDFLNVCISNFANENTIKDFKKANQLNFEAKVEFLRSNYSKTLSLINTSQNILKELYHNMLSNVYDKDTEFLLNIAAPLIVNAKDKKGEYLLSKGYDNLEISRKYLKIGFNWNQFLFSNKIRYYIDGIKRARQAKRFAFLAIIESKTPLEEKKAYKTQTLDEALNPDFLEKIEKVTRYEKIRDKLQYLINQNLIPQKTADQFAFFLQHDDNYGFIILEKKSIKLEFFSTLEKKVKELKSSELPGEPIINNNNQKN